MATDEPRWEVFSSDLKVSKMVVKQLRPSLRFDIPILSQAPPYNLGSGRLAPRVDLQLEHDTNAFIVNKLVLPLVPFTEPDDPRQRRVYYIVGWPDLLAARPVIDATRILDYVSPRTLEDWEYQDTLRRLDEEEQAAREARLAAEAAAAAVGAELLPNGKKKPGRKPKNAKRMQARAPSPQLNSEQEEQLARRRHGPSLSTPQKSRIAQLDAEMEMLDNMGDDEDDEEAMQRQLENEVLGLYQDPAMDVDEESDALDMLGVGAAVSGFETSRASSLMRAPPALESEPLSRASSIAGGSKSASAHYSPASSSVKPQEPPVAAASSLLSQAQRQKPFSTTPIPLPPRRKFGSKVGSASPAQTPTATLTRTPIKQVPTTKPVSSPATSRVSFAQQRSSPVEPPPSLNPNGGFTPTNGFTPIGGTFPRPPKRPADDSPPRGEDITNAPPSVKSKKERKKKAPRTSQPPPEPTADSVDQAPAEQEWVVKRLEGHDIVDGQHYFKVRWEGDWPPDQNPTWEPRENVSADLVERFLKQEAKKAKKTKKTPVKVGAPGSSSKSRSGTQTTLAQWVTGYSSVSEAFEGKAELDATVNQHGNGRSQGDGGAAEDDDEEGDELLVVDESRAEERKNSADELRRALGAQVAAQFASIAPGRRGEH